MSDRTKQVQFGMPEELYADLKAALAYDKSSLADFSIDRLVPNKKLTGYVYVWL